MWNFNQINYVPDSSSTTTYIRAEQSPSPESRDVITIYIGVGPSGNSYIIHKDLLCHHSSFFSAAFNGGFLQDQTLITSFLHLDSTAFGLLVHWLYTNTIGESPKPTLKTLSSLIELADEFHMSKLVKVSLETFWSCLPENVNEEVLAWTNDMFAEGKGESKLLAEVLAREIIQKETLMFQAWMEKMPLKVVIEATELLEEELEKAKRERIQRISAFSRCAALRLKLLKVYELACNGNFV